MLGAQAPLVLTGGDLITDADRLAAPHSCLPVDVDLPGGDQLLTHESVEVLGLIVGRHRERGR